MKFADLCVIVVSRWGGVGVGVGASWRGVSVVLLRDLGGSYRQCRYLVPGMIRCDAMPGVYISSRV